MTKILDYDFKILDYDFYNDLEEIECPNCQKNLQIGFDSIENFDGDGSITQFECQECGQSVDVELNISYSFNVYRKEGKI